MTSAGSPPRPKLSWRIVPVALVTAVVIGLLIRHIAGVDELYDVVAKMRWSLVGGAVVVLAMNFVLGVLRWKLILHALSFPVSFLRCAHAVLAVWPLAVIIPARAGDVFRSLAISDEVPVYEGAGSVITEKAIDVQSLCLLSIAGSLSFGLYRWTLVAAGVLVAEWATVLLLLRFRSVAFRWGFLQRIAEKVGLLSRSMVVLFRSPGYLAAVIASSLASWVLASLIVYLLMLAANGGVGFGLTLALWPMAVLAGTLPLTVAGMGTRDAAFLLALNMSAPTPFREESVLAATLGFSLIATWLLVIVGLPFSIRFALRRLQRERV